MQQVCEGILFSAKFTINKRADGAWHDAHFEHNESSRISFHALLMIREYVYM